MASFSPMRVQGNVESVEDLDGAKIRFHIEARHLRCISGWAFRKLYVWETAEDDLTAPFPIPEFNNSVYFHPNICDDGWAAFRRLGEGYRQLLPALTFPITPLTPRFWKHGIRGSAINCWPPSFFTPWIEQIAQGGTLSLQPTPPDAPVIVLPELPDPPSSPPLSPLSSQSVSLDTPPSPGTRST